MQGFAVYVSGLVQMECQVKSDFVCVVVWVG